MDIEKDERVDRVDSLESVESRETILRKKQKLSKSSTDVVNLGEEKSHHKLPFSKVTNTQPKNIVSVEAHTETHTLSHDTTTHNTSTSTKTIESQICSLSRDYNSIKNNISKLEANLNELTKIVSSNTKRVVDYKIIEEYIPRITNIENSVDRLKETVDSLNNNSNIYVRHGLFKD